MCTSVRATHMHSLVTTFLYLMERAMDTIKGCFGCSGYNQPLKNCMTSEEITYDTRLGWCQFDVENVKCFSYYAECKLLYFVDSQLLTIIVTTVLKNCRNVT